MTFQVLEGVDKGRAFHELPIPVTIGREEGNMLRLNDERVSRYHAKVQQEDGDVILTDLDSTNGTRVNGMPIQIRRLRIGDQISLGRSMLLFGSLEEIASARRRTFITPASSGTVSGELPDDDLDFDLEVPDNVFLMNEPLPWVGIDKDRPPLPQKLTAAQAARLSEVLDYLHRGLSTALEQIEAEEGEAVVRLPYNSWQIIQTVQLFLAKYGRDVAEPPPSEE